MERQRERILTLQNPPPGSGAASPEPAPLSTLMTQTAREHPLVTAAVAAGVVAVVGPRRLLRVATWALPIVWKLRR
ncbi:MAG: hypothetical protein JSS56_24350 [Proteobacteria bacterium]|nr:hypothetical protein [Pseudomonadota bacterium]